MHKESLEFLLGRASGVSIVSNLLLKQSKEEQKENWIAMRTVISSIRCLATNAISIRGHKSFEGNLYGLLEERAMDVPALEKWLKRRNNWLDGRIQNEILEMMCHSVQRSLVANIKQSLFVSLIADGTTDVSGLEQFSICLRWVNPNNFETNEEFMGVYQPNETTAQSLFCVVKDTLVRLGFGLDFHNIRGLCFDGAANMSGRLNGLQKLITDEQPKAIYVHCSNHALDLALQETARTCTLFGDTLSLVKEVTTLLTESRKRKAIFQSVESDADSDSDSEAKLNSESVRPTNLLPLCPTRWVVRVKALKRFLSHYKKVIDTIKFILENPGFSKDDKRASLQGFYKLLRKRKTLFCIKASILIFSPCEQLSSSLQSPKYSASGAYQASNVLLQTLKSLRNEEKFEELWLASSAQSDDLNLKEDGQGREKKIPARFEQTNNPKKGITLSSKQSCRKDYFECLDRVTAEVERRFNQKGMKFLVDLETLLIDSIKGCNHDAVALSKILGAQATDFDLNALACQLSVLKGIFTIEEAASPNITIKNIKEKLTNQSETVLRMVQEVVKLLQLLLVIPASSASSERSFSALRRIKTYMRTTMTQKRLTHLLMIHIHKEEAKHLNVEDILEEFVKKTSERKRTFGERQ